MESDPSGWRGWTSSSSLHQAACDLGLHFLRNSKGGHWRKLHTLRRKWLRWWYSFLETNIPWWTYKITCTIDYLGARGSFDLFVSSSAWCTYARFRQPCLGQVGGSPCGDRQGFSTLLQKRSPKSPWKYGVVLKFSLGGTEYNRTWDLSV